MEKPLHFLCSCDSGLLTEVVTHCYRWGLLQLLLQRRRHASSIHTPCEHSKGAPTESSREHVALQNEYTSTPTFTDSSQLLVLRHPDWACETNIWRRLPLQFDIMP